MIQVYIELTNITWEQDEDGSIAYEQGTSRSFVCEIPDSWEFTDEGIDEAIADSLECLTGYRPKEWQLRCFDDAIDAA